MGKTRHGPPGINQWVCEHLGSCELHYSGFIFFLITSLFKLPVAHMDNERSSGDNDNNLSND